MKRKAFVFVLAALLISCTFAGCGKYVPGGIEGDKDGGVVLDPNKTTLSVQVYNGGTGTKWIANMANAWNPTNAKYQIQVSGKKDFASDVETALKGGPTMYSAYFTPDPGFQMGIMSDMFEDLSDIANARPDGEGGLTVREKLLDPLWEPAASKNGQGIYMLPYADSYVGMVYDHRMFTENGWTSTAPVSAQAAVTAQGIVSTASNSKLIFQSASGRTNYKAGDVILTAGKDGKYGTYDDGQPQTETEFTAMIQAIMPVAKPFIYTGGHLDYVEPILRAAFAQIAGIPASDTFYTYDSKGVNFALRGAAAEPITVDNGYKVFGAAGLYTGLEFINTYFNESTLLHPACLGLASHTDTQKNYILGYRNINTNPLSAILIEGNWWENEARGSFEGLGEDRAYGKRDYRFMLLPDFAGQKGIDGTGHGSVFSVQDNGAFVVPKTEDKEKLAAIKEFLTFTLSEENLRKFTVETGVIRPYQYSLTDEDRAAMTRFAVTAYDVYRDAENIKIIRPFLLKAATPLNYNAVTKSGSDFPVRFGGMEYARILLALRQMNYASASLEDVFNGMKGFYSVSQWGQFVDAARNAGYYK